MCSKLNAKAVRVSLCLQSLILRRQIRSSKHRIATILASCPSAWSSPLAKPYTKPKLYDNQRTASVRSKPNMQRMKDELDEFLAELDVADALGDAVVEPLV